jgi:hypothetical protein
MSACLVGTLRFAYPTTPNTLPHSRDTLRPRFTNSLRPKKKRALAILKRGRREDRVHAAPAVSCASCASRKRTRAYRFSGGSPAFPAQWFYGFLRALPGDRLCCHRRQRDAKHHRQLDASVGASGPHDFAVRSHPSPPKGFAGLGIVRRAHQARPTLPRPPHPAPNVRDDGETPLSWGTGRPYKQLIWVRGQVNF